MKWSHPKMVTPGAGHPLVTPQPPKSNSFWDKNFNFWFKPPFLLNKILVARLAVSGLVKIPNYGSLAGRVAAAMLSPVKALL